MSIPYKDKIVRDDGWVDYYSDFTRVQVVDSVQICDLTLPHKWVRNRTVHRRCYCYSKLAGKLISLIKDIEPKASL